ncbi:hypothetical protein VoSk93_53480 [Vibrio owensii]
MSGARLEKSNKDQGKRIVTVREVSYAIEYIPKNRRILDIKNARIVRAFYLQVLRLN